jgi:hypothetical protein
MSQKDRRFKNKVLQFFGQDIRIGEETLSFFVPTIFEGNTLRITLTPPEDSKVFTVFMRFSEIPSTPVFGMNPYSGKWNFHAFTEVSIEEALQDFRHMVLPYTNKGRTIKALSKRAKVDDNLARLLKEYEQNNFANCKPYMLSKYLED